MAAKNKNDPKTSRKSLGEQVFDQMLRSIKSGSYKPDERLPTEHELASEFHVSRPVVREALGRLREQGHIYSRQGAGSFVRNLGLRQPLGFGNLENLADLQRCYEFRLTVEPDAAYWAAERHDAGGLDKVLEALEMMRDATERQRHREDADFMFHLAVARASNNQYYATAMEALEDHIAVGMQFHGHSLKITPGGLDQVFGEHRKIYEAIRDGHGGIARDLMHGHLTGSLDRLFEGKRLSLA